MVDEVSSATKCLDDQLRKSENCVFLVDVQCLIVFTDVRCMFDWWFGTFFIFPYIGNVIIPTDKLHYFSEG